MNLNEEDIDMCQRAFAEMDEVLLLNIQGWCRGNKRIRS